MSGLSASGLKTQIRSYTEVDDGVLTDAVLENIILNAQQRIFMDLPMDSDRHVQEGTLAANDNTINAPAGCMFIRGIEVFNSTANTEGNGTWLEKKDQTYLAEFVDRNLDQKGLFKHRQILPIQLQVFLNIMPCLVVLLVYLTLLQGGCI